MPIRNSLLGASITLALGGCSVTAVDDNWRDDRVPARTLPRAPQGVELRRCADFSSDEQKPVRIGAHPLTEHLYVLGDGGDVWLLNPTSGARTLALRGQSYIDQPERQEVNISLPVDPLLVNSPITLRATLCLGLTLDRDARLYIVVNVQIPGDVFVNRVDIYRTARIGSDGRPTAPKLWTTFSYPYGVGGFNHGACRIAQGPDGMIYLGSGSRTDHGEAGEDANVSRLGEGAHPDVPGGPGFAGGDFTASILRFDPAQGQQEPFVFSRGNRNPFGFDWDDQGRLIDAENGPMADHPEELNHIREGKHYGFPYVFGDGEKPDYADSPAPPAGMTFEPPIRNDGPGGILGEKPMYSLTPHACPTGLAFYSAGELPARYAGTFFLARFGNLVNYNRIGFDVLNVRLSEENGRVAAVCERFLDRLARPVDICVAHGKLYIVEYCKQTETAGPGSAGFTSGGSVIEVRGAR